MRGQDATPFNLFKVSEGPSEQPAEGCERDCLGKQPGELGSRLHHYERVRY